MKIYFNPQPKPNHSKVDKPKKIDHKRGGISQKRRGSISPSVRETVKNRSKGLCEVRKRCKGAVAVHMCHLQSRNTIEATTPEMILHGCVSCHLYLDTTDEGIKYKRMLREKDAG